MRFLELAWEALRAAWQQVAAWASGVIEAGLLDPRGWGVLTWAVLAGLVVVGLVLGLVRRRQRRAARAVPELMISHGEITLEQAELQPGFGAGGPATFGAGGASGATHRLSLTLSNLEATPLQLLELAVRTRGQRRPVVAEAGAVVPPNGAVDVVAELYDLPGEVGVVELFLYSGRGRRRTFRLSAPLEWEPWAKRFRIVALSSVVTPVQRLASQELRRQERRAYETAKRRERSRELMEATWRKAGEFSQQLKERRAGATEKRVAAMAGDQLPLPPRAPQHDRYADGYQGDAGAPQGDHERDAATEREREPTAPRPRLDFPDEF